MRKKYTENLIWFSQSEKNCEEIFIEKFCFVNEEKIFSDFFYAQEKFYLPTLIHFARILSRFKFILLYSGEKNCKISYKIHVQQQKAI